MTHCIHSAIIIFHACKGYSLVILDVAGLVLFHRQQVNRIKCQSNSHHVKAPLGLKWSRQEMVVSPCCSLESLESSVTTLQLLMLCVQVSAMYVRAASEDKDNRSFHPRHIFKVQCDAKYTSEQFSIINMHFRPVYDPSWCE